MSDFDRVGLSKERLFFQLLKEYTSHAEKIIKSFDALEESLEPILYGLKVDLEEFEDYIDAREKEIHVPLWNELSKVTPDDLRVNVIEYLVFLEPEFVYTAIWKNGNFWVLREMMDEDAEEYTGSQYMIETEVTHWIPVVYPSRY